MHNHQFETPQVLTTLPGAGRRNRNFILEGVLENFAYWTRILFQASHEPIIRHRVDLSGVHFYRIYDPVSRTHHWFTSEAEVRTWLEDRHYRQ